MADGKEFVFTWKIENYDINYIKFSKYLKSPCFTAENIGGSQWYLKLYPVGLKGETQEYASCFLTRSKHCHYSKAQLSIDFVIKLVIDDEKTLKSYEYKKRIFKKSGTYGEKKFIKKSELLEELEKCSKNEVTISCFIKNNSFANYCESETNINTEYISFKKSFAYPDSSDWEEDFIPIVHIYRITDIDMYHLDINPFHINLTAPGDEIIIRVYDVGLYPVKKCLISVLDIYNVKQISQKAPPVLPIHEDYNVAAMIPKQDIIRRKETLVKDGKFVLLFECSSGTANLSYINKSLKYTYSRSDTSDIDTRLITDFGTLFSSMNYNDVEIRCSDKKLFAHKSILSARSPVFCAMFDLQMTESQTGIVNCEDINSKIMYSFLEFVYTGRVSHCDYDTMLELLIVADKYQVASLQDECGDFLLSAMSVETILDLVQIADLTRLRSLKNSAIEFIKKHSLEISSSSQYMQFIEQNLKLSANIICQFYSSN